MKRNPNQDQPLPVSTCFILLVTAVVELLLFSENSSIIIIFCSVFTTNQNRVGLVDVLLGILDWRAGGRQGLCNQMKWNESEASIGRVLAVEVSIIFWVAF